MTANQINYWSLQEDKRHNVEQEGNDYISAQAAWKRAEVEDYLKESKKFNNYASGVGSALKGLGSVTPKISIR